MADSDIPIERLRLLNERSPTSGDYVLYWMQQSQRATFNHALEYAVDEANRLGLPLLVAFGLTDGFPEANLRHYSFLLEGLFETQQALEHRGIPFVLQRGSPDEVALRLGKKAAVIVCDRGYLRIQREWREKVAKGAACQVVQVESDAIVPIETASPKAEIGARTLRPRINRQLERFLVPLRERKVAKRSRLPEVEGIDLTDLKKVAEGLKVDRSVAPVAQFTGGTSKAEKLLQRFVRDHLDGYDELRKRLTVPAVSYLSMYFHFGQISPLQVALAIQNAKRVGDEDRDSFLEEMIVRRELAFNFVFYNANYDRYEVLPTWAQQTLSRHRSDIRQHQYSRDQFERAETHDPYWNAAMQEMVHFGYLHNHLRMYWGKKILEWSTTPEEAFETAIYLNNKYFLDGRDPCSFANIAWVFGQHDRPWPERPIYGQIRCMMGNRLEQKTDVKEYVEKLARRLRANER
jgi:deoxyribodipyrimidine photo-lyase